MDVLDHLDREAKALGIALHSVELTVDREPVISAGASPLGVHTPHRMYSVAKTLTGLAVGLLADEGGLTLDDRVTAHFPEHGHGHHPWLEQATVRHLLAMLGPHATTTYQRSENDWLASWFRVPPAFPPGAVFTYDTSGSYVLSALVERVAGTTLAGYLRHHLAPLGLADDFRIFSGPDGVSHGGSGLVCRPRDLLRLAHLLLDGGLHDGEALLPAGYLREATTVQADTAALTWGSAFRGYGYQLWLPERGGYLMFGLGGQIVYCEPDHRLALVVTADTLTCPSGDQRLAGLVFRHLVDPVVGKSAPPADDDGPRGPATRALTWPTPRHLPEHALPVRGRYLPRGPIAWTDDLDVDLSADGGVVASSSGEWRLELRLGAPHAQPFGPKARPAVVAAGWAAPRTLDVEVRFVDDEPEVIRLRLHAGPDGTLTVRGQGSGERADPRWTFAGAFSPSPSPPARP
ncbi:serine hydrolase domain-containing protein [Antribacter gilvus]|uniref:serine hydrolase domain-containing protein n=1 Tax=Antribacter gilvus TaxID=2304675 RepID=UPI000F7B73C2|nr:serine hydrolase [Antribacter gilvus]